LITPGATGTGPNIIPASGTDTNIDLILRGAGTGGVIIGSTTTPFLQTATGKTNTGYLSVLGKTSAGLKITCADNMGFTLIVSAAAVATGDRTLTLPDPGGNDSFAYLALAQTFTGAMIFSGGLASTGALSTTDGVGSGTAKKVGGIAARAVAASTALTASSTETVFSTGTYTVPANTIKQGTVVRIRFQGIATATNSSDTLGVKLYISTTTMTGTVLITIAAADATNDDIFQGEFTLVGRAAPGATAACVGVGSHSTLAAVGGAVVNDILATTNLATNAALIIEVAGKWSSTNAGNSCRLDFFTVEII
jgi:hypothetical protein